MVRTLPYLILSIGFHNSWRSSGCVRSEPAPVRRERYLFAFKIFPSLIYALVTDPLFWIAESGARLPSSVLDLDISHLPVSISDRALSQLWKLSAGKPSPKANANAMERRQDRIRALKYRSWVSTHNTFVCAQIYPLVCLVITSTQPMFKVIPS